MARWGKLAAGFHANPKAVAAGLLGRAVFVFALDQNARDDMDGRIRIGYFGANYLARLLDITPQQAEEGFNAAIASDLLAVDGKYVRIVGWDEEWQPPATSASRTAAWRERKTANTGDVTVTPGDASDGLDKSRSEKIREEKKEPPNPLSGGTGEFEFAEGTKPGKRRKRLKADEPTAEEAPLVAVVLEKLSERAGREYRPTTAEHVGFVLARLRDRPDDVSLETRARHLRLVIWDRWNEWHAKPDMQPYLRPSTVFNRSKFAEYLPAALAAEREEQEPRAGPKNPPPSPVTLSLLRGERP